MLGIFRTLTFVGAIFGTFFFFIVMSNATSAVQEAAGAAVALACVVIPYCVTRIMTDMKQEERLREIVNDGDL